MFFSSSRPLRTIILTPISSLKWAKRSIMVSPQGNNRWFSSSGSAVPGREELISSIFNISSAKARKLMEMNTKLTVADVSRMKNLANIVKKTKLNLVDIIQNPNICIRYPGRIEQRYYCLLEMGVKKITIEDIIRYPEMIQEKICSLGLTWDPLDSLSACVDGPSNLKEIILENYPQDARMTLNSLHRAVVLEYLVWRLGISREKVLKMVGKYLSSSNKSLTCLVDACRLLIEDIGFPIEKIRNNAFLLNVSKDNVECILNTFPTLAGIPIREYVHKFPRVLSLPVDNIKEVDLCLAEFDVTSEQILKCGSIYSYLASTLRTRLKIVMKNPQLCTMKTSPRFLFLIYYYQKVLRRLDTIQLLSRASDDGVKLSVDFLTASDVQFNKRLTVAYGRIRKSELMVHLSKRLNLPGNVVRKSLFVDFHKLAFENITIEQIDRTLSYLFSDKNNFDAEDIFENLQIIVFDVENIEDALAVAKITPNGSVCWNQSQLLKSALNYLLAKYKVKDPRMRETRNSVVKYGRHLANEDYPIDEYLEN